MIEYLKLLRASVKSNNALYARPGEKLILKLVVSDDSLICKLGQSRKLSEYS
jgi:hypothetical protein